MDNGTEEGHQKEHHDRGEGSQGGNEPCRYPLPRSTSFHSKDNDVIFESPAFPNDLAQRPLNPYDTSPSDSRRKPIPYEQPSTRGEARGDAGSPPPWSGGPRHNAVGPASPQLGLTRIDTYQSTGSDHSLSSISLEDPMGWDMDEDYVEVPHDVKVPKYHKNHWPHPFS